MARTKKKSFWSLKQGCKNMARHLKQTGKELSTIPAYGARELTGRPHDEKHKCKLKRGWFE